MVFCNLTDFKASNLKLDVTILILIDGFLQYGLIDVLNAQKGCHNPYFNRWFSAIELYNDYIPKWLRHNPYFNRWFSAIRNKV